MKQRGLCMNFLSFLCGCTILLYSHITQATELTIFTEEYPPLSFMADGAVGGLATEVVRELINRTGTAAEIRLVPWQQGYRDVIEKPDSALYSTVMTSERKELLQWVGPIGVLETSFYALKSSGTSIANLDAARKVGRIATVTGYYSEQALQAEGFTNLESCPDEAAAMRKLLSGEVQLLVGSNTSLPAALHKVGASMDALKNAFIISTDLTYVAFSRTTPASLVRRWQQALDTMKRDGSFQRIYARWLPGETPVGVYQLVTEQYPPVTFMQDGKPSGLVTDMVREIAAQLGIPDAIRLTSWKNAYSMARLYPNVILFSAERTPEREQLFQWVGPVGNNSAAFYAKKGSGIALHSLDDARKVNAIATTTNWFTEQYLQQHGFTNLASSPDPVDNVRQLMTGKVQLAIFTDITIPEIAKAAGYRMEDLEPILPVSQTYFYIAISKDTPPDIAQVWQETLDDMKRDGRFEKIYRSYLPHADIADLLSPSSGR